MKEIQSPWSLIILGLALVPMGVMYMRGNFKTMRAHHWAKVSPENIKPFGMLVGLGTVILALGLIASGVLMLAGYATLVEAVLIAFAVIGLGLNIFVMCKYNGGLFGR